MLQNFNNFFLASFKHLPDFFCGGGSDRRGGHVFFCLPSIIFWPCLDIRFFLIQGLFETSSSCCFACIPSKKKLWSNCENIMLKYLSRTSGNYFTLSQSWQHRRRMEREAKAKVVASVWGTDFVQFLATLAVLPRSIVKNRMNLTVSFKSTKASAARNWTNSVPQADATTFTFSSLSILLLC